MLSREPGRQPGFATVCAAVALTVLVAGCGFQPLYSRGAGIGAAQLSEIEILPIKDRVGQKLRNILVAKLNPNGAPDRPRYLLSIVVDESRQGLAVRKDEFATRANLSLTARFSLTRTVDEKGVLRGQATSTSSFNILTADFATLSAENDARDRSVTELSEAIKSRVAIYLNGVK